MRNRKWGTLLALLMVLAMCVWTLSACGSSNTGETEDEAEPEATEEVEGYTNAEVTSDLSMADAVKAYYDAVDMDYAYDLGYNLAYDWDNLAEANGWRSAGSDAEHATADYLVKEWESIGLQNVDKLASKCDKFQFNSSSMKIADSDVDFHGNDQEAVEAGTNGPASYQVSGTDGDLTAEIVNCKTGFEADYEGKDMEGKIALVKVDQKAEAWIDVYMEQAKKAGCAALVTWANSGYGEAGPYTTNVQDVCSADIIPTVAISADQAKQVRKAIKEGHNQCTLNVDAEMVDDGGTTYNVVGMIPGKSHDQKIVVSGHYDKYWYGFQDDCCAISLVAAIAKGMIDSGYEPENDIYFIAHGAEEWGVTDSQFDWTTGAWGVCEEHSDVTDNCLAMINCELPAFKVDSLMQIVCVPEFRDMVATMFDSGLIVTRGEQAFSTEPVDATTMEDGITYRIHGVPYFLNGFEGTEFMCQRYHTIADNAETYDADTFETNIDWYGAYAMYIDTEPALELNIGQVAIDLENNFNEDYSKAAGMDPEKYLAAVGELKVAGTEAHAAAQELNAQYEEAVKGGDEEAAAELRTKGADMNKKALAAFQEVQDKFFYDSDFTADYGQLQTFNNLSLIDGVLTGLENGADIWGEEGDGIADYAYNINCIHDYNYYNFSADIAERGIDMYTDAYYANKDQGQWGYGHQNPVVHVGDISAQIQRAETVEDVDVEAATKAYTDAKDELLKYLGTALAAEITYMSDVSDCLK
ncbi:MAG: M28 family peptidase [Bacillota bacterium]